MFFKGASMKKYIISDSKQDIAFIKYGVNVFLKDKTIKSARIGNNYGTIELMREISEKTITHAIGFGIPYGDENETEEDLKKGVINGIHNKRDDTHFRIRRRTDKSKEKI